jgi:hypothetical protein
MSPYTIRSRNSFSRIGLAIIILVNSSSVFAYSTSSAFILPSRKIGCVFHATSEIISCSSYGTPVIDPAISIINYPTAGERCSADIVGISIGRKGKASGNCSGSPHPFSLNSEFKENRVPVLKYRSTWSSNGIACTASIKGLTCKNSTGDGFFMSQQRWRLL